MSASSPSPDFERLVALASGELDAPEARAVEEQTHASREASEALTSLRMLIGSLRQDDSTEPTSEAIGLARAVFRHRPAESPAADRNWLAVAIEAIATLIHDSRRTPALAGLRGAEDGYRMSFATPTCEVDLQIEPVPARIEGGSAPRDGAESTSRVRLLGQATSDAATPVAVAIAPVGTRDVLAETESDEHGVFSFTVAPGRYDLMILGARGAVVLPDLDVP